MNLFFQQHLLARLANNNTLISQGSTKSFQPTTSTSTTSSNSSDNESNLNQLIKNNNLLWNSFVNAQRQFKGNINVENERQDQIETLEERNESKANLTIGKEIYRDNHVVVREVLQEGFNFKKENEKEINLNYVSSWDKRSSFQSTSSDDSLLMSTDVPDTSSCKSNTKLTTVKQQNKKREESSKFSYKTFIISTPRDISQQLKENEALIGKRGRGRPKGKTNVSKKNKQ
ncbi:hypothetical protein ABK040_014314 [Willaertia magna]